MLLRSLRSIGLVTFAWVVVASLPGIARYLRMRQM
jgi:hypothetical protein